MYGLVFYFLSFDLSANDRSLMSVFWKIRVRVRVTDLALLPPNKIKFKVITF